MPQPPGLSYRVLKAGTGWYWEVRFHRQEALACGTADTRTKARARAILALLSLVERQPKFRHNPSNFIDNSEGITVH